MLAYEVDEQDPASVRRMKDFAAMLLERLETAEDGDSATEAAGGDAAASTAADRALAVLYDDGTDRLGSLWFLEAALTFPPGQGYTIPEIALKLQVDPAEARAYRRNLGRALSLAVLPEVPDMPDFFRDWWDPNAGVYRYEVTAEVRAAARRRGLA